MTEKKHSRRAGRSNRVSRLSRKGSISERPMSMNTSEYALFTKHNKISSWQPCTTGNFPSSLARRFPVQEVEREHTLEADAQQLGWPRKRSLKSMPDCHNNETSATKNNDDNAAPLSDLHENLESWQILDGWVTKNQRDETIHPDTRNEKKQMTPLTHSRTYVPRGPRLNNHPRPIQRFSSPPRPPSC